MAQEDGDRRMRRPLTVMVLVTALGVSAGADAGEKPWREAAGWQAWRSWLAGVVFEFVTREEGGGIDPNGAAAPPAAEPGGGTPEFEPREEGVGIDPDGRVSMVSPPASGAELGSDGDG